MIVLKIIGIVLLIFIIFAILGTILMMSMATRIEVRRKIPDQPLRMRISFGPVKRVFTLGQKKKKKPAKPQQKKTQKKPQKQPELNATYFDMTRLDYDKVFALAVDWMDDLSGSITWERLHITVILHKKDAAQTGILLGKLSAFVGNLYPYMERAFVLQDTKIVLDADFDAEKTVWGVDISLMTRPIRFVRIVWRRKKQMWDIWKSIRTTKEERAQWMREHTENK